MNDGKDVEGTSYKFMRCIFCYVNLINVPNPRIKIKKYYHTYGITSLKKHVDVNHSIIGRKT